MSLTNRQLIERYVADPDPDFTKGVRRANNLARVADACGEPVHLQ